MRRHDWIPRDIYIYILLHKKMAQVKVLHMLLFPAERHMKGLLTV